MSRQHLLQQRRARAREPDQEHGRRQSVRRRLRPRRGIGRARERGQLLDGGRRTRVLRVLEARRLQLAVRLVRFGERGEGFLKASESLERLAEHHGHGCPEIRPQARLREHVARNRLGGARIACAQREARNHGPRREEIRGQGERAIRQCARVLQPVFLLGEVGKRRDGLHMPRVGPERALEAALRRRAFADLHQEAAVVLQRPGEVAVDSQCRLERLAGLRDSAIRSIDAAEAVEDEDISRRHGPCAFEQRLGRLRIARAGADVAEDLECVRLVRVAAQQLGAGGFRLGPGAGFVGRDGAAQ